MEEARYPGRRLGDRPIADWWNDHSGYNDEHCFGWYRRTIQIPKDMQGKTILLNLGKIDDCDQTFFNGTRIGATGQMPPHYATAWETPLV